MSKPIRSTDADAIPKLEAKLSEARAAHSRARGPARQNLAGKISGLENRLADLRTLASSPIPADYVRGAFRMVWDEAAKRVAILSPKPSTAASRRELSAALKKRAFIWAPSQGRYQRVASRNAWDAGRALIDQLARADADARPAQPLERLMAGVDAARVNASNPRDLRPLPLKIAADRSARAAGSPKPDPRLASLIAHLKTLDYGQRRSFYLDGRRWLVSANDGNIATMTADGGAIQEWPDEAAAAAEVARLVGLPQVLGLVEQWKQDPASPAVANKPAMKPAPGKPTARPAPVDRTTDERPSTAQLNDFLERYRDPETDPAPREALALIDAFRTEHAGAAQVSSVRRLAREAVFAARQKLVGPARAAWRRFDQAFTGAMGTGNDFHERLRVLVLGMIDRDETARLEYLKNKNYALPEQPLSAAERSYRDDLKTLSLRNDLERERRQREAADAEDERWGQEQRETSMLSVTATGPCCGDCAKGATCKGERADDQAMTSAQNERAQREVMALLMSAESSLPLLTSVAAAPPRATEDRTDRKAASKAKQEARRAHAAEVKAERAARAKLSAEAKKARAADASAKRKASKAAKRETLKAKKQGARLAAAAKSKARREAARAKVAAKRSSCAGSIAGDLRQAQARAAAAEKRLAAAADAANQRHAKAATKLREAARVAEDKLRAAATSPPQKRLLAGRLERVRASLRLRLGLLNDAHRLELRNMPRQIECSILGREKAERVLASCGSVCQLGLPGGIGGAETLVTLQVGRGSLRPVPARFVLTSAASLIPSNDAQTFAPRADYPELVQERRYDADPLEQGKVIDVAQNMQPGLIANTNVGAVDGTPVVTDGAGVVLGGNGRTMGAQRHYLSGRRVLAEYLERVAHQFGFTPSQVRGFKDPIVVRVIDAPRAEWPRLVRDLNIGLTQSMDPTTQAVAEARQFPPEVSRILADGLADAEIGEWLRSRASLPLIGALERSGLLTRANRASFLGKDGLLSDTARTALERQLVAALVPDADLLDRLGAEVRNALTRSAPFWLASAAAGGGWDIRGDLLAALRDLADLRSDGQCLANWERQVSLVPRSTRKGTIGETLLRVLDLASSKPLIFSRIARAFYAGSVGGGGLFGAKDPAQALVEAAEGVNVKPEAAASRRRCKK